MLKMATDERTTFQYIVKLRVALPDLANEFQFLPILRSNFMTSLTNVALERSTNANIL